MGIPLSVVCAVQSTYMTARMRRLDTQEILSDRFTWLHERMLVRINLQLCRVVPAALPQSPEQDPVLLKDPGFTGISRGVRAQGIRIHSNEHFRSLRMSGVSTWLLHHLLFWCTC